MNKLLGILTLMTLLVGSMIVNAHSFHFFERNVNATEINRLSSDLVKVGTLPYGAPYVDPLDNVVYPYYSGWGYFVNGSYSYGLDTWTTNRYKVTFSVNNKPYVYIKVNEARGVEYFKLHNTGLFYTDRGAIGTIDLYW
jgi:hypothetical protein